MKTPDGIYTCRARGNFRKKSQTPLVGDYVKIRIVSDGEMEGYVEEIEERKNSLIRPPIANIDRLIIVSATANPSPDTVFIDKMTAICEHNKIEPVLCFNKSDLQHDDSIIKEYKKTGYKVIVTSTVENTGLCELEEITKSGITAVAGFSGVGKSSLLNTVLKNEELETGSISERLLRGKHTTRHLELYPLEKGGFLADTPGFSNLDINMIRALELSDLFREFSDYEDMCRYHDCTHRKEPGCAIAKAVEDNLIPSFRHENYIAFYNELDKIKEWERK
ncbi:MAG: ribosome small subunit-dependent GTPase A [Clostridia bacterium]|nr:ribosome small subunit-dependent GTPase A [Clostridia bacterium]